MNERLFINPQLLEGIGPINAAAKKMAAQMGIDDPCEVFRKINAGEWVVSQPERAWREHDGVIYFTVTSDGTTGEEWITRLETKGVKLTCSTKQLLRSEDFTPTNGITHEVVVLNGRLFQGEKRVAKNILDEAGMRGLTMSNVEVAFLIHEKFSDEELEIMGLWGLVTMHEPINNSDGGPRLIAARLKGGHRWIDAYYGYPGFVWGYAHGFAFVIS